jgi:hypothetical protein
MLFESISVAFSIVLSLGAGRNVKSYPLPNMPQKRTLDRSLQLTWVALRRHTSEAVGSVAGRDTPIRSAHF